MSTTATNEQLDIETATTAAAPDAKTRRYDRQLRLWAATGQSRLESARILLVSASATSTQVLKNLVLPGIGHFTILDDARVVDPADAGNNFFLDGPNSLGKSRAAEAVRLLGELNDGVEGVADEGTLEEALRSRTDWLKSFTLVIAHNLQPRVLDDLAGLLWKEEHGPSLIAVRSAGFLAEFFLQFHEHTIIESHSETVPSLRIDKPLPALLEHARSLDLANMDITEHGHIPYVVILVRALDDWKKTHDNHPPKTYPEKQEFKRGLAALKRKPDEENIEEAEAQAYRCWTETNVPSEISDLYNLLPQTTDAPFYVLLRALKAFTDKTGLLPLSASLPDMKASTEQYVHLQGLYKQQAEADKTLFAQGLQSDVPKDVVDTFVKNAHGLKILRGKPWGAFNSNTEGLANALQSYPRETATHLALSALSSLLPPGSSDVSAQARATITADALKAEVQKLVGQGVELPDAVDDAVGEIARAPTADVPNTAAFLGGLVAQESIKLITQQYVPVNGYCVVDLVETWTGVIGG
ncbi:hypothetical protein PLICRDRAFT_145326 [Plicaturopsis crispa FD-325 SS-3]|nr:hypothetical protein PLICRDRAFT_145326 [Plicaturopsis crispa FD-325 SS-3]